MTKPLADPPTLWIDSNEEMRHHWSEHAGRWGFRPVVEHLPCDFRFVSTGLGRLVSIERKSVPDDLTESFKDGRLSLQTQRMVSEENRDAEVGVLLLEGELITLDPEMYYPIQGALWSIQAAGVIIVNAIKTKVLERLMYLYQFLEKEDHAFLRRPVIEMPSKFQYSDREMYGRVKTLITFRGISENSAVPTLRRYSLGEILDKPEIIREVVPHVPMGTIRGMYAHMQREVPEGLDTSSSKRAVRKKTENGNTPIQQEIDMSDVQTLTRTVI